MLVTDTLRTVDDIPSPEWDAFTRASDIDSARGFLQFREYLEPGESLLLTARSAGRLTAALRGVVAVPGSGLTSDPWKFLGSEAVLRLDDNDSEQTGEALRRARSALVRGAGSDTRLPLWQELTRRVGPCLVIREFDRSELLYAPEADEAQQADLAARLVRAAQSTAADKGAGAVVFPYVSPADTVLRATLTAAGFRRGTLTGASRIETAGFDSYEEYLAALPSRRRRLYRTEEQSLTASEHLTRGEADLAQHAARVAELEANTLVKHGGIADAEAIRLARITLADRLPDAVRVPVVRRDGETVACALHLLGRKSVVFMTYGCDYAVEDRGAAYPWAAFYHPVRTAIAQRLDGVRLGFEGFEAKTRRGAVVEPRETWAWTPDADALRRLGELLDLVDARNDAYLSRFPQATADRGRGKARS
ncbi:GNAT family N-acetyltransferase [Streptomyces sp. NRRL S-920]|uniref:GNAT family N-acetyltransferase n=1 Tax=Streptomyces sp. NRRL S-920 TaxID=1463921 RepID=UPI00099763F9|nr:GNAT family N-acetyltransferase [Streptomyces sp. NRRL S-920]